MKITISTSGAEPQDHEVQWSGSPFQPPDWKDFIALMERAGFIKIGTVNSPHLGPTMRGAPIFSGLEGPRMNSVERFEYELKKVHRIVLARQPMAFAGTEIEQHDDGTFTSLPAYWSRSGDVPDRSKSAGPFQTMEEAKEFERERAIVWFREVAERSLEQAADEANDLIVRLKAA